MYGKATETAIAVMSRLAEIYDGGRTRVSASQIAESRGLQGPFVAKVLTTLSAAGLVRGSRGPGGGFTLARQPSAITLYDVFCLFERQDDSRNCPFGGGICGAGEPCPIHEKLVEVQGALDGLLHGTTFEVFRVACQEEGKQPTPKGVIPGKPRESFRASIPARLRRKRSK